MPVHFYSALDTRSYKTPEGFPLGTWHSNLSTSYKKGKLDKEKVSRLEEIGFIWNLHEEAFEQGCQETLRYKKQSGDANAPIAYKTPEGFALGPWQSRQRDKFKQGILDKRNIKKLEEVGFLWKKRRAKMRNKDNLGLDKSK
tara:strand:- start:189 stop:614 length:426 start_codon:yes stop_codon:yes gene_type:complete